MDRSTIFRLIYAVFGLLAAVVTVIRVTNGETGSALFTGVIAAFCGYRLYTFEDE